MLKRHAVPLFDDFVFYLYASAKATTIVFSHDLGEDSEDKDVVGDADCNFSFVLVIFTLAHGWNAVFLNGRRRW